VSGISGRVTALAVAVAALVAEAGCVKRPDVSGTGDERLEDTAGGGDPVPGEARQSCGPEGGMLVLLDAATASPLSCTLVTVTSEEPECKAAGGGCPAKEVFRGMTNVQGRAPVAVTWDQVRLAAVAEGYVPSYREPSPAGGEGAEIEMIPSEGFLLKFVDAEGSYLTRLEVTFKQGGEAIAQKTTNELANVYFPRRSPFSGEPVAIEAHGYAPVTVNGPQDLGADGHTVTLRK
jgi:hypothetical protein